VTLRKALATLPPTLDKTYDRILAAIDESDTDYAIRILLWLAFSKRPLSIGEIAEVVAIDVARDPAFNREEVLEDPREVLEVCSSLVTITMHEKGDRVENEYVADPRQFVRLAHYSVKEYLVSTRIQEGQAARYSMQATACHINMAKACLGYLDQFQSLEPLADNTLAEFKLAEYSARYWASHILGAGARSTETSQAALHLLSADNPAYLNWIRIHDPETYKRSHSFRIGIEDTSSPLRYAAFLGLEEVTKLLLDNGADANVRDGNGESALHAAAARDRKVILKLLLDNGADIDAQNKRGDGPLLVALKEGGHEETVRLLLDRGANVNAQNKRGYSPLLVASGNGSEEELRLLLDRGANVNAQNKLGESPLLMALEKGHEERIRLLLNRGADVNAQSKSGRSPLSAASGNGDEETVQLLLDRGADVNAQNTLGDSPLLVASKRGYKGTVRLLLDRGAYINAQSEGGESPLSVAAGNGHEETVQLLLNRGADINAQSEGGESPLSVAAGNGHEETVQLLLNRGADINAQSEGGESPLSAASGNGYKKIVGLLLNRGADINAQSEGSESPLSAASGNGYKKIVGLLLDHGAYLSIADENGCTPFRRAITNHHPDVVELLLEKGAEKFISDTSGCTPLDFATDHGQTFLHLAAKGGRMGTFQYYIGLGLDQTATDAKGDDALYYASSGGCVEIVKALLNKGTTSFRGSTHWSPIHWACRAGAFEIVELLVEAGFHSEPVTTSQPQCQWSPLDIALYLGKEEMLDHISASCRSHLGAKTNSLRRRQKRSVCDGCLNVSG
jgi:ankyrin repeat protein